VSAELEPLLAPLPGEDPCGPSLRQTQLFTDVRLAREEDDPNLPMGQWERPLKRADWAQIAQLCAQALSQRTKDLQLAAWLLEAWTRQQGLAGLGRGLALVHGLVERYWDGLHPRIEDGDADARVAPLEWLNEALGNTLLVHVTLVPLHERKPGHVTLADWQRMLASELAASPHAAAATGPDGLPPLTRDEVTANARRHAAPFLAASLAQARQSREAIASLAALLDAQLGREAPNLSKLANVLESMERVLAQLQPTLVSKIAGALGVGAAAAPQQPRDTGASMEPQPSMPAAGLAPEPSAPVQLGQWSSRDEAYRTLEALADYLGAIEPHSPTPYLIRRAVNWGRMPLPELFAEIMREEGDLNRMMNVLGLQRPD
jgi:type VI secretion system protein ImpA